MDRSARIALLLNAHSGHKWQVLETRTKKRRPAEPAQGTQGTEGSRTTLKHCLNQSFEIAPVARRAREPRRAKKPRRPRSRYSIRPFRGSRIPWRRAACFVSEPVAWLSESVLRKTFRKTLRPAAMGPLFRGGRHPCRGILALMVHLLARWAAPVSSQPKSHIAWSRRCRILPGPAQGSWGPEKIRRDDFRRGHLVALDKQYCDRRASFIKNT